MIRTLTITAAEWESRKDGRLWLVRDADLCTDRRHYILRPSPHNPLGTRRNDVHDDVRCANPCSNAPDGARRLIYSPPVEFVQACAPCEACVNRRTIPHVNRWGVVVSHRHCDRCRIELVGPGEVLGHAYAVGQPLPIYSSAECFAEKGEDCIYVQQRGEYARLRFWPKGDDLTDRLAHYGPPESLVGKWAIELAVVA